MDSPYELGATTFARDSFVSWPGWWGVYLAPAAIAHPLRASALLSGCGRYCGAKVVIAPLASLGHGQSIPRGRLLLDSAPNERGGTS